jgi:hypothetical protein
MPSVSKAQQHLMAMALHNPEKISKDNSGVVNMKKSQLKDFASTKTKKLPVRVKQFRPEMFKNFHSRQMSGPGE